MKHIFLTEGQLRHKASLSKSHLRQSRNRRCLIRNKTQKKTVYSKRSKSRKMKKRRSKRSLKKVTRRLRTRLFPSDFVEKKEDSIERRFYVLGLCSCDTRQQRDEIDKVIKDLQENALLPMESYEIHMINHTGKHQRPGCVPNDSINVFNKRFLFQFGIDQLPSDIEKHKYSVIFNHFCPYFVLTMNIPLLTEMMRTDYSHGPYLINPASKSGENKRYEQLTNSFDLIVPELLGDLNITGEKKKWSVYQLKN
jgi:hypothetical protein